MKSWAFIILLTIAICSAVMYFVLVYGVGVSFDVARPEEKDDFEQNRPISKQPVKPPPTHVIIDPTPPTGPDLQISAAPVATPEAVDPLPSATGLPPTATSSGLSLDLSNPTPTEQEDDKNSSELSKFIDICVGWFKSEEEQNKDAQNSLDEKNLKTDDVNDQYKEYMRRQKERMRDFRNKNY